MGREGFDGGEDMGIDVIDDAAVAFGGGVQTVRLIVSRIAGNSFQEKGDQGDRVLLGDFGIDVAESLGKGRPQIGQHLHAA